jgi:hypothetical protein
MSQHACGGEAEHQERADAAGPAENSAKMLYRKTHH